VKPPQAKLEMSYHSDQSNCNPVPPYQHFNPQQQTTLHALPFMDNVQPAGIQFGNVTIATLFISYFIKKKRFRKNIRKLISETTFNMYSKTAQN
jgi:hypothetical protein